MLIMEKQKIQYEKINLTSDDIRDNLVELCFQTSKGNFKMSYEDMDKLAWAYLDAMGYMDSQMEKVFEKIDKEKGYGFYD